MEREKSLEAISNEVWNILNATAFGGVSAFVESISMCGYRINFIFDMVKENYIIVEVRNGKRISDFDLNSQKNPFYDSQVKRFYIYLDTIIKLINSKVGNNMDYKFWYVVNEP